MYIGFINNKYFKLESLLIMTIILSKIIFAIYIKYIILKNVKLKYYLYLSNRVSSFKSIAININFCTFI